MLPLTSKLFPTYKCSYADLLSSAVTTRYHRLRRVCERSIPPTSNTNSSWLSTTFPCSLATSGHRKRPFSSRFAHTHSPLPSQNSNFSRFRCAFENTKTRQMDPVGGDRRGPIPTTSDSAADRPTEEIPCPAADGDSC